MLAVMAALVPVVVFSMVWKPSEGPATKMTAGVEASAASAVTSAAPSDVAPPAPSAEPSATSAPSVSATMPVVPVVPSSRPHPTGKRGQPRGEDPYADAAAPGPLKTAEPVTPTTVPAPSTIGSSKLFTPTPPF